MIKSLRCRWEVPSPTAIANRQAPVAQMDRAAVYGKDVRETSSINPWKYQLFEFSSFTKGGGLKKRRFTFDLP